MRGKGLKRIEEKLDTRITPAYAGKRLFASTSSTISRDHPRLCGEKRWECDVANGIYGSPPPMRGKDSRKLENLTRTRITPAYAGKRLFLACCFSWHWDHPRLCGEKVL